MSAPVMSAIDGVNYGTPMYDPDDETSLGYTEAERQENMLNALRAYKGRLPNSLKKKAKAPDLNMPSNRCRSIVDTGVAFLVGKEPQFDAADDSCQDQLDACWKANRKPLALEAIATNGAIFGTAFVKVHEEGIIKDGQKFPRIIVLDPMQVTVETMLDDCSMPIAFNIMSMGMDAKGKKVQRRQRIERTDILLNGQVMSNAQDMPPLGAPEEWTICNQIRTGTGSSGQDVWADDGPRIVWPYGWCPVHACSNLPEPNTYYGAPDLTPDLITLQKKLNASQSYRHQILYYHAYPKTWGKGFQPSELSMSPDEVTVIASETGMLQNLEMSGNLAALDNHIEDCRADMDELSSVPSVATGRIKDLVKGVMPGITIRLMFQPLLTKTEKKQYCYGDMLNTLNSHLIEMMNCGIGVEVQTLWQEILPVNMAEWATFAPVLQSMGVSKQTLVGEAGYDWEAEQEKSQLEQQAEADLAQQALANFDAGRTPGADVYGQGMPPAGNTGGAAPQAPVSTPPAASAALNHPAMQAQRAAAVATAGGA